MSPPDNRPPSTISISAPTRFGDAAESGVKSTRLNSRSMKNAGHRIPLSPARRSPLAARRSPLTASPVRRFAAPTAPPTSHNASTPKKRLTNPYKYLTIHITLFRIPQCPLHHQPVPRRAFNPHHLPFSSLPPNVSQWGTMSHISFHSFAPQRNVHTNPAPLPPLLVL